MAVHQYPLDKAFLAATWLEALIYGCFLCVFCFGVYIQVISTKGRNTHNQVMFIVSIIMFILATLHVAMNCFRLIRGFSDFRDTPGGPVGYLGNLALWDHVFKDTLYATQSILGDAVAVYRCWILWNKDYRFIIFPSMLLIGSTVSGYMVCGLYTSVDPTATVFNPRLTDWITTFYSIAVAQNIITTGLMAIRLWQGEKKSARYRVDKGNLMPVLRILVESAALYLFIEILLLSLYSANYNAQYVLLEIVTPTVGITFGMISIRITMRAHQKSQISYDSGNLSEGRQTFGSIPLRRITVNISKHTEDDTSRGGDEKENSMGVAV
ncbi:hypothetical protein B0H17DRAFT_1083527 [Mycena rosella]|uniref:Uncharacterized protein n=1 Tax=Mycena rosella TaxID=1033263 RepID=A0AAD7D1V1_MYCRO|nr:hypothetical protein B0H17DRAFT_1083527 [Mycena rosella]